MVTEYFSRWGSLKLEDIDLRWERKDLKGTGGATFSHNEWMGILNELPEEVVEMSKITVIKIQIDG